MTEEELYFLKTICFLSQYKEYSGQFRNKISNRKMGLSSHLRGGCPVTGAWGTPWDPLHSSLWGKPLSLPHFTNKQVR